MNYQEELEKIFNDTQNIFADRISELIRSINNKERIIEFLKNMKIQPSIEVLKRINSIAIEKEDYETCNALKDYCKEKALNL